MNPPFHDARRHNVSPDAGRRLAYTGAPGLLQRWTAAAAFLLKPGGVLTLIWRADALDEVLAALAPAFGEVAVLPVRRVQGAAPIRVLVRAVKGGRRCARDARSARPQRRARQAERGRRSGIARWRDAEPGAGLERSDCPEIDPPTVADAARRHRRNIACRRQALT